MNQTSTPDMEAKTQNNLKRWFRPILYENKITDYEIELVSNAEVGEGFIGEVLFVRITGETTDGDTITRRYVVKHSKDSEELRKDPFMALTFLNEIRVYDVIIPTFVKFQRERKVKPWDNHPRCFGCIIEPNVDVIILDDLKEKNFKLHDRFQTLDLVHMKVVLNAYSKYHALSMALRDQCPDIFDDIAKKSDDIIEEGMKNEAVIDIFTGAIKDAWHLFEDEPEILEKVRKLYDESKETLRQVIDPSDPNAVFIHGDCWNNNYLFKYNDNGTKPVDVKILDWQLSRLASPIVDISFFIYATGGASEFDHMDELLRYYHEHLCDFMKELGSDPDSIFPYGTFKEHWTKYSRFGATMVPINLRFSLCKKDEAPDMTKSVEGGKDAIAENLNFKISSMDLYNTRVRDVMRYASKYNTI